jgi:hypothetical protein
MGIKICDWWMSLLQHSCCKTHIFTKTFEASFTHVFASPVLQPSMVWCASTDNAHLSVDFPAAAPGHAS